MSLEIKSTSKWWYARLRFNGRHRCVNLGVEVVGQRPASLRDLGDRRFEASRTRALVAHDALREELRRERQAEYYLEALHRLRGGESASLDLVDMSDEWELRHMGASAKHRREVTQACEEFAGRCSKKTMAEVTARDCDRHAVHLARRLASSTVAKRVGILRGVFRALASEAGLSTNPWADVRPPNGEVTHRMPLSDDEVGRLLDVATDDARRLIVVGHATALRLSDCARLERGAVDWSEEVVRVRTSKTGSMVEIPIFEDLRELLEGEGETGTSKFYFPHLAKLDPPPLSKMVMSAFREAGVVEDVMIGKRKFARKSFHSFRVTWVTRALSAGVPIEVVRRVTGHATVQVVLDNYYKPGAQELREILKDKMARLT